MKTRILSLLMIITILIACKKKEETVTETELETTTVATDTMSTSGSESGMVYACSMHPEITGAKGDTCSECGMALTEAVGP